MADTKEKKLNKKGNISIHTENIFPIIKKWLYSDHEIFLRELVSNGHDAINKLQQIASKESIKDIPEAKINITVDEKAKTLTFSDTGLGLDEDEVEKYITQIAFSSAEEFIEKYKDSAKDSGIIGHFGLGFYSAFMVSDSVEIISKSYKKSSPAIHWSCDGSPEFNLVKSRFQTS